MPAWSTIRNECGFPYYLPDFSKKVGDAISEQKQETEDTKQLLSKTVSEIELELGANPQDYSVVFGLGSPLTSQRFYVCKPIGKYSHDFAKGCQEPSRSDAGGFTELEDAIACFLQSYNL